MDDKTAKELDKTVFSVTRCFGREFTVLYRYSDEDGNAVPSYPDFDADPVYTEDGIPFTLASRSGCSLAIADVPGKPFEGECGACSYFAQEEGFSLFGLCMNEQWRLSDKQEEDD